MTKMHCLGTGGYHPSSRRHTSCYFVPKWGLLLDAGTGIFRLPPLIELDRLDILLTHAHLDHTFGLTVLLDVQYQRPMKSIHLWAEAEKIAAIREHLLSPLLFPVELPIIWHPIEPGEPFTLPHVSVTSMAQDHPGGSLAFRITGPDGASLVYATDTTGNQAAEFAQWADQPDLMVHECYFRDDGAAFAERTGHTFTSRLIDVTRNVSPKSLLVSHLNPLDDSDDPIDRQLIVDALEIPVTLAEDELVLPITP